MCTALDPQQLNSVRCHGVRISRLIEPMVKVRKAHLRITKHLWMRQQQRAFLWAWQLMRPSPLLNRHSWALIPPGDGYQTRAELRNGQVDQQKG